MKKLCIAVFAPVFFGGYSLAQGSPTPPAANTAGTSQAASQSQPPNTPESQSMRIAPGSVIPVQLTKSIDAKKAKTGDEVEARVTQDMKAGNGELIVPKDTKVVGHVTEAQAHSKDQKESQIGIAFDHAVLKDGHDVSLPVSIQAIIAPQALNPGNSDSANSAPSPSDSGAAQPSTTGRSGGMGGSMPQPNRTQSSSMPTEPEGNSGNNHPTPQITANTQGVVGISDVTLSAAQGSQASVVSSEKKNVKLDNGTLMPLRVNQ